MRSLVHVLLSMCVTGFREDSLGDVKVHNICTHNHATLYGIIIRVIFDGSLVYIPLVKSILAVHMMSVLVRF